MKLAICLLTSALAASLGLNSYLLLSARQVKTKPNALNEQIEKAWLPLPNGWTYNPAPAEQLADSVVTDPTLLQLAVGHFRKQSERDRLATLSNWCANHVQRRYEDLDDQQDFLQRLSKKLHNLLVEKEFQN